MRSLRVFFGVGGVSWCSVTSEAGCLGGQSQQAHLVCTTTGEGVEGGVVGSRGGGSLFRSNDQCRELAKSKFVVFSVYPSMYQGVI